MITGFGEGESLAPIDLHKWGGLPSRVRLLVAAPFFLLKLPVLMIVIAYIAIERVWITISPFRIVVAHDPDYDRTNKW